MKVISIQEVIADYNGDEEYRSRINTADGHDGWWYDLKIRRQIKNYRG